MTDQWLVRTSQNLIHGPYSKQEICQFIQGAKLTTLDEVCSSSGYWFFLHEIAEVKSQLGVNPPVPAHHPDDEVTETEVIRASNHLTSLADSDDPKDTQPVETTGTTIMGSAEVGSQMRSAVTAHSAAPAVGAEREKEAAAAVHRAFRRSQEREDGDSPTWIKKFETLSFWKTVTIFLVIVTAALFFSIMRLIRE